MDVDTDSVSFAFSRQRTSISKSVLVAKSFVLVVKSSKSLDKV